MSKPIRSVNEYECAIANLMAQLRHCVNEMRRAGIRIEDDDDARRLLHAASNADALLREAMDEAVKAANLEPPKNIISLGPTGMVYFSEVGDPFGWDVSACTAHHTETPEERQRKLDEARKRVQQAEAQHAFNQARSVTIAAADGMGILNVDPAAPDFGAQVSDQLAQQRGIDRTPANDAMRVPAFEERETERKRMAEHFRKAGIL